MNDNLYSNLEEISQNLVYVSETDSAVVAFKCLCGADQNASFRKSFGIDSSADMTPVDAENFFQQKSAIRDYFNDRQKVTAEKFGKIYQLFKDNGSINGFRFGDVSAVYVFFVEQDGEAVGIKFESVET